MVSLSKHLRQMQNISTRAAVLFVYIAGAGNLCMFSVVVSLTCGHERDLQMAEVIESFCCTEGLVVVAQFQLLGLCIMNAIFCIEMSVALDACAV